MNQFHYHYDKTYQCLVKATPEGREVSRINIPYCDLERICVIIFHETMAKTNLEKE